MTSGQAPAPELVYCLYVMVLGLISSATLTQSTSAVFSRGVRTFVGSRFCEASLVMQFNLMTEILCRPHSFTNVCNVAKVYD